MMKEIDLDKIWERVEKGKLNDSNEEILEFIKEDTEKKHSDDSKKSD